MRMPYKGLWWYWMLVVSVLDVAVDDCYSVISKTEKYEHEGKQFDIVESRFEDVIMDVPLLTVMTCVKNGLSDLSKAAKELDFEENAAEGDTSSTALSLQLVTQIFGRKGSHYALWRRREQVSGAGGYREILVFVGWLKKKAAIDALSEVAGSIMGVIETHMSMFNDIWAMDVNYEKLTTTVHVILSVSVHVSWEEISLGSLTLAENILISIPGLHPYNVAFVRINKAMDRCQHSSTLQRERLYGTYLDRLLDEVRTKQCTTKNAQWVVAGRRGGQCMRATYDDRNATEGVDVIGGLKSLLYHVVDRLCHAALALQYGQSSFPFYLTYGQFQLEINYPGWFSDYPPKVKG